MSEITMKSTKEVIFKALQDALAQANGSVAAKHDPVAEARSKKDVEVVHNAVKLVDGTWEDNLLALKKVLVATLDQLNTEIADQSKVFSTISEAINVQREKLQELYDIEVGANTLISLVNAKTALSQKLDVDYAEKKSHMDAELTHLQQEIKDSRAAMETELAELRKKANQEHDRLESEWQYEFNRKKVMANNDLDDQLTSQRRELDLTTLDAHARLDNREKALKSREENLAHYEDTVAELQDKLESLRHSVTAEVTEKLTTHFNHEKVVYQKEAEKEQAILNHRINGLESHLSKSEAEKAALAKKLDDAYEHLRKIAADTVANAGDKKVNVALESVIREISSSKNQSR